MRHLALISLLGLAACGQYPYSADQTGEPPPVIKEYSIEGVKLLSPEITQGQDSRSFGQERYPISSTERLLLRLLRLKDHVDSVRQREGDAVELKVTLVDGIQVEAAREEIEACPITRSWMMLSTWDRAHPFSGEGRWAAPGGDFDPEGCVKATRGEGGLLAFDVTRWFRDFPMGRGQNLGLMLKSSNRYLIHGDRSGSHSPRLSWKE